MGALELGERSLLLVGALAVLERACLGGERRLRLGRVLVVLKHGVGLGRVTVHRVGVGLVCEQMPARVRCSCGRPGTTLREVGAPEQVVMWWEATPARDRTRARRERCVRERARSAARRQRRPGCAAEEVHGWSWRAVDWFDEGGGGGENAQAVQRDGAQGYAAGPVSTRRTYEMSHVDIPLQTVYRTFIQCTLGRNIPRASGVFLETVEQ